MKPDVTVSYKVKFCGMLQDSQKKKLDEFFFNCHKNCAPQGVKIGSANKIKEDYIYDAELYEINYHLTYSHMHGSSQVDRDIGKVCRKWCDEAEIPYIGWLKPSRSEGFLIDENEQDIDISVSEISFGTIPFMSYYVRHWHFKERGTHSDIMCSFFHTTRYFSILIAMEHRCIKNETSFYKIDIQYKSFSRILVNIIPGDNPVDIYFYLEHPPVIFHGINKTKTFEENDAKFKPNMQSSTAYSASMRRFWERNVQFGCKCNNTMCHLKTIGRTNVLKVSIPDKYRACRIIHRLYQKCPSNTEVYYGAVKTVVILNTPKNFYKTALNSISSNREQLEKVFHCQYAWEAIFSGSLAINDQLLFKHQQLEKSGQNFLRYYKSILETFFHENPTAFCSALNHIYFMINRNCIFDFEMALQKMFEHFRIREFKEELPDGMCMVRRIIVTPSRTILIPPIEHFDNRVVREFTSEYMLRLSVEDDNFSKLTFGLQFLSSKDEFLNTVIGDILRKGIVIGSRHYEMLAASSSQLREHGMWMVARDNKGRTANSIREWMGDFSKIKNVAKYMARMGQCFSTSDSASQLSLMEDNEVDVKEIKCFNGWYTFSDGIGMISSALSEEVRESLSRRQKYLVPDEILYKPSAFQIRYRGFKGMVVESPILVGRKIGLRPSMNKFDCSNSSSLEIVKTSAPRRLFLNRPLITILEQLGVPSRVFMDLQTKMIVKITDSLIYESKAVQTLTDFFPLNISYAKLHESGFLLTKDTFFHYLLLGLYKETVDQLKLKTRIAVPPAYGRNMMGVLDETKTLKYGEVFVQYSSSLGDFASPLHILKGEVVVTKNPCMHPGDVRKLHAVDIPELHYIKDCIVFPAKGKRPHPDEMAGSDLDGDEYVVIWYPDLVFPQGNVQPMSYPSHNEAPCANNIGVEEMIQFFCNYISNDHIGSFGNAHLAWADWHKNGIFSNVCLNIAKKYPMILDFAKTGYSVVLQSQERPHQYPDFMEKGHTKDSYRSARGLGLLYRASRHLQACVNDINLTVHELSFDCYLEYPGWECFEDWAENMKLEYVEKITDILNKYGVQSEIEALSSCIVGNLFDRNRYDSENSKSVLKAFMKSLLSSFRLKLLGAIEKDSRDKDLTLVEKQVRKYQRASAVYVVVYKKQQYNAVCLPWIAADILSEVRRECLNLKNVPLELLECSLMKDGDAEIQTLLTSKEYVITNQKTSTCQCVALFKVVLQEWMKKYELNISVSVEKFCSECHNRIFMRFFLHAKCCSYNEVECNCANSCSAIKYTIHFLKFCLLHVTPPLGKCSARSCLGFIETNLQYIALQTYAQLATRRNISFLGITSTNCVDSDYGVDSEGDPVSLPVKNETLKTIISTHKERVQNFLKEKSGVKKIHLSTKCDHKENWHLFIYSYGKSWQRWNLEELVLNPKLTGILQKVIAQTST